jgi:hypothetical protein
MRDKRLLLRRVALCAAVVATVPYLVLKLLWLNGSRVGMTDPDDLHEMSSTRFVAGNTITILLMLIAAAFVIALTRSWATKVPAAVVFVLGAGATGLLAPILVGLPIGAAVQAVAKGDVRPAPGTGLAPWVFGIVYSGFGLLGLAMGILVVLHVLERWGALISQPPERPSWPSTLAGALGLLPFGAAMGYWGVAGVGDSGPQGMDLPAQRTVLVVTGVLSVAAFVLPGMSTFGRRWPRLAWLVTWTGCCVAALQGPTEILLAQGGKTEPAVAAIALLATPGACIYGVSILKRRLDRAPVGAPSTTSEVGAVHRPVQSRA